MKGFNFDVTKSLFKGFIICLSFICSSVILEVLLRYTYPPIISIDNKLGWRCAINYHMEGYREDIKGNRYFVKIDTNQQGFRFFGNVNTDKKKILFIGDSVTQSFGRKFGVSNDKTFYGICARELPCEVFAYGCVAYGTLQEYMILDEYIDLIKPDIVVWQYSSNDFSNNLYEMELSGVGIGGIAGSMGLKRPYITKKGDVFYALPLREPQVLSYARELSGYSYFLSFIFLAIDKVNVKFCKTEPNKNSKDLFRDSIEITGNIMKKVRARAPDVKILAFCSDEQSLYYEELKKISSRYNIEFIEGINKALQDEEKKGNIILAADGGHWVELGHWVVYERLKEYILKKGYL